MNELIDQARKCDDDRIYSQEDLIHRLAKALDAALAWQASRVQPVAGGLAERLKVLNDGVGMIPYRRAGYARLVADVAALEAEIALAKKERDQAIETLHLINGHSYDRKVVPGQEWTRQWLEGYMAAKGDVDDLIESRHETKEIWPGEEVQP